MESTKTKTWSRLLTATVIAAVTLTTVSCDHEEKSLLETVPSSAAAVVSVDLDRALKDAGCQVKNGQLTLTPDITTIIDRYSGSSEATATIAGSLQMIDRSQVIVYEFDGQSIATFKLTDVASATATIAGADPQSRKEGDLTVYDCGGETSLAIDGNQGWLTKDIRTLTASLEAATTANYTLRPAVARFLEGDGMIKITMSAQSAGLNVGDYTLCTSISPRESVLRSETVMMDPDGKLYQFGSEIDEINTDFLRYLPDNTVLTFACGNIRSAEMKSMLRSIAGGMSEIRDLIDNLDGTLALSASPIGGSQSLSVDTPEAWDYFGMAHMSQENVDKTVDQINYYLKLFRMPTPKFDNGQYSIEVTRNTTCYYGNIDGYLAVSTREIKPVYSNSLTDSFEGKRMALVFDVPSGSELMKATRLPYGVNFRANLQLDRVVATLKFNGARGNVMSTIAELAARNDLGVIKNLDYTDTLTEWM